MKILVVDDEKVIVKAMKFNLERDGYTVEVAYDGEEALKLARDKTISLIILDLMLPKKVLPERNILALNMFQN